MQQSVGVELIQSSTLEGRATNAKENEDKQLCNLKNVSTGEEKLHKPTLNWVKFLHVPVFLLRILYRRQKKAPRHGFLRFIAFAIRTFVSSHPQRGRKLPLRNSGAELLHQICKNFHGF